jgi:acetyl-CoA carboxylase biotin carboxylase subunit
MEYDPILSKLIVHAENRELAIHRMIRALESTVILGIKTPIPFLIDILKSEAFQAGDTFTDFIPTHFESWQPDGSEALLACIAYIAHAMKANTTTRASATVGTEFSSPWATLGNWKNA